MQIKTTVRYHITPVRMATNNKSANNRYWPGCGEKGTLKALLEGMQTSKATVEDSMEFPQKIKNKLPFDPEIPLLEIRIPEHRFKRTFAPICSK